MPKQREPGGEPRSLIVRFSEGEYEALRNYAFVTDRKMAEVVRRAVSEYLATSGRREQMRSVTQRIRQARRVALDKLAEM